MIDLSTIAGHSPEFRRALRKELDRKTAIVNEEYPRLAAGEETNTVLDKSGITWLAMQYYSMESHARSQYLRNRSGRSRLDQTMDE
jgi:hypothetical protein